MDTCKAPGETGTGSDAERLDRGRPVGCLAGVLSFAGYRAGLARAGLTGVTITVTREVTAGLQSAIVQAIEPDRSGGG